MFWYIVLVEFFCPLNSLQYWCFLSKQKSKIHCRNLSVFNIVILNISIKILPFVSVIHDQLCTEGWQIAGQSTGNGQCNVDPQVAACRIPGWSCCIDLQRAVVVPHWSVVQHLVVVFYLPCLAVSVPEASSQECKAGSRHCWAWALLALHRARTPCSAAGAPAEPDSASGADGHTAHGESSAHCSLGRCFLCFTRWVSCFGSWEIL